MYRILYVDDEPGLLEIAKIFLERGGEIRVDTHVSVKNALPLLMQENYDAIISDYQMPGMDGIQFLKRVREAGSTIPFILFTGKGREEIVIQALNEGADFSLQKGGEPISQFAELSNKVRYAINSKRAEEAVKEKTAELDRFFNSSLDLLCIADTEGKFRRLNPEWEQTLGYPVNELLGKRFLDLVHPDDLGPTMEAVARLGGQNVILNFQNRYRHKDGSYRWIEWRSYPHGNLIYAAARDVTDRKLTEEALLSEKNLTDAIFNSVPGMIYLYDAEGHLIRWNKKHELMTGYSTEELSHMQLADW
ncbi:MAG: PAS domain S-box protein, partial [Methanomicrobiales archaeon]|nr:PAS domain S-box protein [Methanomicrobiales archaeon]